jgi:hypothetical protein
MRNRKKLSLSGERERGGVGVWSLLPFEGCQDAIRVPDFFILINKIKNKELVSEWSGLNLKLNFKYLDRV